MAEAKVPRLDPRAAHEMGLKSLGWECSAILQAMVDRFGSEEAQKMIYPYMKEIGRRAGASLPQMGITGKDAMAIASWIDFIEDQVLLVEGRFTETSPDRVVKEITKCPLQRLTVDFCRAFQGMTDGIIEEVNPDYKWYQTRVIPQGVETCEWVVEKK